MKVSELFEAPQFAMPTSFNLDNKQINQKFAAILLGAKNKHIVKTIDDTTHIYEFNTGYALIDSKVSKVLYYVKFKVARISYVGRPCLQQIKVWRDYTDTRAHNIAKEIFFDHLLPKFGCIVTDVQQTEGERSGQAFWFNRISDAFREHMYVYFVSLIPRRTLKQIRNNDDLQELISGTWGWDHKYQAKRIIISDRPLKEKAD